MNQAGTVSASLSTTTIISGSHLFNISGYSITRELPTGKSLMSTPFVAGGYRWAIRYYPNGISPYDNPGIAFTLELQSEGTNVELRLEFCLMDSNGRPSQVHKVSSFCEFSYQSCNEEFSGFITHSELHESGYLRDDSFVVQFTVGILGSNVVESSESPDCDTIPADGLQPSDLHEQLGKLLDGGEGAEVTFNVGGQIFSAHRCILGARSPVFHEQFFGAMSKKSFDNVEVEDMEATVFNVLLQYLYTDSLPELTDIGYSKFNMDSSASAIMALLKY